MAMMGWLRPVMVIMMEKIWMPLPIIHIMNIMKKTCMTGSLALASSAWQGRAGGGGERWGAGAGDRAARAGRHWLAASGSLCQQLPATGGRCTEASRSAS